MVHEPSPIVKPFATYLKHPNLLTTHTISEHSNFPNQNLCTLDFRGKSLEVFRIYVYNFNEKDRKEKK